MMLISFWPFGIVVVDGGSFTFRKAFCGSLCGCRSEQWVWELCLDASVGFFPVPVAFAFRSCEFQFKLDTFFLRPDFPPSVQARI
mgnify:CR=1 FL=1